MSAVEALAEVLEAHDLTADGNYTCVCGWSGERQSMGDPTFEQHQASFLVAAIRSMPAEQVAELVGGEVERKVGRTVVKRVGSTNHYGYEYGYEYRAATPWLPPGVSPETNGEQK